MIQRFPDCNEYSQQKKKNKWNIAVIIDFLNTTHYSQMTNWLHFDANTLIRSIQFRAMKTNCYHRWIFFERNVQELTYLVKLLITRTRHYFQVSKIPRRMNGLLSERHHYSYTSKVFVLFTCKLENNIVLLFRIHSNIKYSTFLSTEFRIPNAT